MHEFSRIVGLPGLSNFGVVADGVYRSQRPEDPLGYSTLQARGIKSLLDLEDTPDPANIIKQIGFQVLHVPLSTLSAPDMSQTEAIDDWMRKAAKPLLVHCTYGRERTGYACARKRIISGWSLADAREEMLAYGFRGYLAWPLMESLKTFAATIQKGIK